MILMLKIILKAGIICYSFFYYLYSNLFQKIQSQDSVYTMSMYSFSKKINKMKYYKDKTLLEGPSNLQDFFKEKTEGRDCDDWARQWSAWSFQHNYSFKEVLVWNYSSFKKFKQSVHMITLVKINSKIWLMNFEPVGPFLSEKEAIHHMKLSESFSDFIDYKTVFYKKST